MRRGNVLKALLRHRPFWRVVVVGGPAAVVMTSVVRTTTYSFFEQEFPSTSNDDKDDNGNNNTLSSSSDPAAPDVSAGFNATNATERLENLLQLKGSAARRMAWMMQNLTLWDLWDLSDKYVPEALLVTAVRLLLCVGVLAWMQKNRHWLLRRLKHHWKDTLLGLLILPFVAIYEFTRSSTMPSQFTQQETMLLIGFFGACGQIGTRFLIPTKTEFQEWLESANNGRPTTLEQQMDLAAKLYHESCQQSYLEKKANLPGALEIIQMLEETSVECMGSLVSWKGFQLGWFLNVFCKTPFMQRLLEFGCELWFVRKVCIIEIICQAHFKKDNCRKGKTSFSSGPFLDSISTSISAFGLEGTSEQIIKEPTTFISYTGGYTLKETLEVLHQLDPNEFVWMDIFCVNQFAWTGKSRNPEMQEFKDSFLGDLQTQIKSIGRTTLLLRRWDNAMSTLGQIWVLWEIFNTAETGSVLNVLLPQNQKEDFVESCLETRQKIERILLILSSIDASAASADDDVDREHIYKRMQTTGFSKINSLVSRKIRDWLIQQGEKHIQQQRTATVCFPFRSAKGPTPSLLSNMAKILSDQGRFEEAERLYCESLSKFHMRRGKQHGETLSTMNNLATAVHNQARFEEAMHLYQATLEAYEEFKGPGHPDSLTCSHNIAFLLQDQGKYKEALSAFQTVLENQVHWLGHDNPNTANTKHNYGFLLLQQGKLDEANQFCSAAAEYREKHLGLQHPHTLSSFRTLALLKKAQGDIVGAESLFLKVLQMREQTLGFDDPKTLESFEDLESLLHQQRTLT